ncbi:hypothetical protein [Timonella sp. A28]|uniref:hypothetical protein n=1 Tax=Timonella sp. A28 TaxID=3442640 RepID=UPI003EBA1A7C
MSGLSAATGKDHRRRYRVFLISALCAIVVWGSAALSPAHTRHLTDATDERATAHEVAFSHTQPMRKALSAHGLKNELCPDLNDPASVAPLRIEQQAIAATCVIERAGFALVQGHTMKTHAQDSGAQCMWVTREGKAVEPAQQATFNNLSEGMWVCTGVESIWAQRGGTAYGNTFLTPMSRKEFLQRASTTQLMEHEYQHYLQWTLLGDKFATLYALAGSNPCNNVFERTANLDDGGYSCS